jgi:hypothetical protein
MTTGGLVTIVDFGVRRRDARKYDPNASAEMATVAAVTNLMTRRR